MTQQDPSQQAKNLHAGHRSRMQGRFLKTGIDGFSDVEVLEFLLGYALPRINTNELAHCLLDTFGDLHKVFTAPVEQLVTVSGVGPRTAVLIRFSAALWNRVEQARLANEKVFRTIPAIGKYLVAQLGDYREERAFLMCLDNSCRLQDFRELTRGTVSAVNLPYRRVVEVALLNNASTVILAHNHLGGSALPSLEDVRYTDGLRRALDLMDVTLADHIVVSGRSYVSMKSSGMLNISSQD